MRKRRCAHSVPATMIAAVDSTGDIGPAAVTDHVLKNLRCSDSVRTDDDDEDDDDVFYPGSTVASRTIDPDYAPCQVDESPANPTQITLLERIIRTHPVWYLPHISRMAAIHLVRGKEVGNFIVRHSSRTNAMAITVKLPSSSKQEVEHYLIESTAFGIHLEGTSKYFKALPLLLGYYCESDGDLGFKIALPSAIIGCKSRRDLYSYALLGQEFWSVGSCLCKDVPPPWCDFKYPSKFSKSYSDCPSETAHSRKLSAPAKRDAYDDGNAENSTFVSSEPKKFPRSVYSVLDRRFTTIQRSFKRTIDKQRSLFQATAATTDSNGVPGYESHHYSNRRFYNEEQQHLVSKPLPKANSFSSSSPSPYVVHDRMLTFKPVDRNNKVDRVPHVTVSTGLRPPVRHGENKELMINTRIGPMAFLNDLPESGRHENFFLNGSTRESPAAHDQKTKHSGVANFLNVAKPAKNSRSVSSFNSYVSSWSSRIEDRLHDLKLRGSSWTNARKGDGTAPCPAVAPRTFQSTTLDSVFRRKAGRGPASVGSYLGVCTDGGVGIGVSSGSSQHLSVPLLENGSVSSQLVKELKEKFSKTLRPRNDPSLRSSCDSVRSSPPPLRHRAMSSQDRDKVGGAAVFYGSLNNVAVLANNDRETRDVNHNPVVMTTSHIPPVAPFRDPSYRPRPRRRISTLRSTFHSQKKIDKTLLGTPPAPATPASCSSASASVYGIWPTDPLYTTTTTTNSHSYDSPCVTLEGNDVRLRSSADLPDIDESDECHSTVSTAGTMFCEPWDSSVWDNLIDLADSMKQTDRRRDSFHRCEQQQEPLTADNVTYGTAKKRNQETNGDPPTSSFRKNIVNSSPPWSKSLPASEKSNSEVVSSPSIDRRGPPSSCNGKQVGGAAFSSSSASVRSSLRTLGRSQDSGDVFLREGIIEAFSSYVAVDDSDAELNDLTDSKMNGEIQNGQGGSWVRIQDCVKRMTNEPESFIGTQVMYFLRCTTEALENDPKVVLGNVRQFINGLKNYLVKQDEVTLHRLIESERCKLASNQFLNIDAILEGVLQKIILEPLKPFLYQLLIKESSKNGTLQSLSENMAAVRNRSPEDIGLEPIDFDIPMEQIREEFRRMQYHYSPVKKLEYLLRALSFAYPKSRAAVNCDNFDLPDADELLRWLVYLLSRCSVVGCEIEANYMWGLLHPALLFGEASYCLTALSSAVHVLKHAHLVSKLSDVCHFTAESVETTGAFLRIAIPEEVTGAIYYHCFPAVPDMSCAKLCRMIAHKFKITNPEDYGLYLNVDGYETAVLSADCPDVMRAQLRVLNKFHLFVYKRHEAKIAWPKMNQLEMD